MHLEAIVAISETGEIGKDNKLLWNMPADLARFKKLTMGKPIIMGRKTHESIGRPLPGRNNIVITRDKSFSAAGCTVVNSIDQALAAAADSDVAFVIGGSEIFAALLPEIEKIYLTVIHHEFDGDAFFPEINRDIWQEAEVLKWQPDDKHAYAYTFSVLERMT
jgi:dihydrofolate reductase